jgi:hypothetical protein
VTAPTITSGAPATVDDASAVRFLRTALGAPGGVSAPGAARVLGRDEAWVYRHLDAWTDSGDVERIGPDPIVRAGRYRACRPAADVPALLAGAAVALADRDWTPHDYVTDDNRVDLQGALRLAAGCHPREHPTAPTLALTVYDAEDELVRALGDPPGGGVDDQLARWQASLGRTAGHVQALLTDALGGIQLRRRVQADQVASAVSLALAHALTRGLDVPLLPAGWTLAADRAGDIVATGPDGTAYEITTRVELVGVAPADPARPGQLPPAAGAGRSAVA